MVMSYDPTMYQGAAAHYRHGRPAYSPQLEAVLTDELDLDGSGRLLDVGCGPGILTVRLATLIEEAVGLDPDPAMLAEARRVAEKRGITNIRWVQAPAEALPFAAPGPYRLVTFGTSFHWTDEARVAETVYDMLEPGGALALIGHTVEGRPEPPSPGRPPIPHDEITALVEKYLGSTKHAGHGFAPARTHRFEDVSFGPGWVRHGRSSSPASPTCCGTAKVCCPATSPSLGRRHTCSVIASRTSPATCGSYSGRGSPHGVFWDWPGDTEVVLARKPR
jgi:SAM-dependent methyltransferase